MYFNLFFAFSIFEDQMKVKLLTKFRCQLWVNAGGSHCAKILSQQFWNFHSIRLLSKKKVFKKFCTKKIYLNWSQMILVTPSMPQVSASVEIEKIMHLRVYSIETVWRKKNQNFIVECGLITSFQISNSMNGLCNNKRSEGIFIWVTLLSKIGIEF